MTQIPIDPDNPQDEKEPLDITSGYLASEGSDPIPQVDEPLVSRDPMQPWQAPDATRSQEILGPYDAYTAEVVATNYVAGDGLYGDTQRISVRRCEVWYSTNNEPVAVAIPAILSQPTMAVVEAMPYPVSHDMANYQVAVGEIVVVWEGRDGRRWYLRDDLPFVGRVVVNDQEGSKPSVTENYAGGAGNFSLNVRRQSLAGVPSPGATLGDLQNADATYVLYQGVLPVGPTNYHHGFRVGDKVMCWRRGFYYFCAPAPNVFVGKVHGAGPNGENDFEDEPKYWVQQYDGSALYAANDYDVTWGQRTQAVAGQTGKNGRWIVGHNLAEPVDEHRLEVGDMVHCVLTSDPVSKEPIYTIDRANAKDAPVAKTAILAIGTEYKALFCMESPEYRFYDHMTVNHFQDQSVHPIDPEWLACVEPHDIHVVAVAAETPVKHPICGQVIGSDLYLQTYDTVKTPVLVRVTISGFVRGHQGERFPERTQDQFLSNSHFWADWAHER